MPPIYSPATNCQLKKIAMTIPSSMTRLVDASRKASDGISPAPLANSEREVASAANEQELEMKPKPVARRMVLGPASPILCRIRSRVTKTWIMLETT